MSPPIYTPGGSEVSEIVLPDGSTASEVIGPDGTVVFEAPPEIPDSVASRPDDDGAESNTTTKGVSISPNSDFGAMGARISNNTSGVTRAYLYDLSDDSLVTDVDISGLSAGDAFALDAEFVSGETYSIVLDAEGSSYTAGYVSGFAGEGPWTSDDVDILDGVSDETDDTRSPLCVNDVGNPDGVLD